MPAEAVKRKLTAILAADVAGYSGLVRLDKEGTLARPTGVAARDLNDTPRPIQSLKDHRPWYCESRV